MLKKQKEYSPACHKIFLGILLVIVSIIFWFTRDIKDAFTYSFFVAGVLFLLKGAYLSSK